MSQTLRRELIQKFLSLDEDKDRAELLADAALEVAGITKRNLSVEESANRTVDAILAFEAKGKAKLAPRAAMWDRADKELSRVQYNLSGARQAEQERFTSFLISEEKKGRTIEKFIEWVFRDEFWVGKINGLNKIMELWLKQDEQKPAAEPVTQTPKQENLIFTLPPEDKLKALKDKLNAKPE